MQQAKVLFHAFALVRARATQHTVFQREPQQAAQRQQDQVPFLDAPLKCCSINSCSRTLRGTVRPRPSVLGVPSARLWLCLLLCRR